MFKAVGISVKSRIITVTSLCLIVLLMGIFFASQSYSIASDAVKINKEKDTWEVGIKEDSYRESEESVTSFSKKILSNVVISNITLNNPGEYYEYSIDLKNEGTLDATIKNISIDGLNDYVTSSILINDEEYNDSISLEKDATYTITIRVTYKEIEEVIPQNLNIVTTIELEQQ